MGEPPGGARPGWVGRGRRGSSPTVAGSDATRSARERVVDDVDELVLALPGVSGSIIRTGRGTGTTAVAVHDLGDAAVSEFDFGFPAVGGAAAHDDVVVLVTMRRAPPGTRWEGIELAPGDTIVYPPSGSHHALDPDGLRLGVVSVPWESFATAAEDLGVDAAPATRRHVLGHPRLSALFAGVVVDAPLARRADIVIDAAVRAVCHQPAPPSTTRRRWESADLVDGMVELLAATGEWHLPLLTVCRHLGVSARRLEGAFTELFGIGPNRYMRQRALHAARRDLSAQARGQATVAEVAGRYGFHHGGRFAAYYRSTFGELPIDTLRRETTSASIIRARDLARNPGVTAADIATVTCR